MVFTTQNYVQRVRRGRIMGETCFTGREVPAGAQDVCVVNEGVLVNDTYSAHLVASYGHTTHNVYTQKTYWFFYLWLPTMRDE